MSAKPETYELRFTTRAGDIKTEVFTGSYAAAKARVCDVIRKDRGRKLVSGGLSSHASMVSPEVRKSVDVELTVSVGEST